MCIGHAILDISRSAAGYVEVGSSVQTPGTVGPHHEPNPEAIYMA